VPYPYSLDGEQRENAAQLVQQGAAFVVEQSQTAAREVYEHLTRLLDEPGPAERTVAQALALGYPDATETVVSDILETIGMEKRRAGLAMYEGILAR
jgi:UDP-N-acetylglucosamine:LPS N-acetylglucosamine transferase